MPAVVVENISMAVGFWSLPTELIHRILLLLNPRDLSRCTTVCKVFWDGAQDSVDIQYKLELYAQGFAETAVLDSTSVSRKMCLLKELALLWRPNFRANITLEEAVHGVHGGGYSSGVQSIKCGLWWTWTQNFGGTGNLFIRDCNANVEHSRAWPTQSFPRFLMSVIVDPLQDLVVAVSSGGSRMMFTVTDVSQDYQAFLVEFRLASSQFPYPHSAHTSLECKHVFDQPGDYYVQIAGRAAICGDRVVFLYYVRFRQTRGIFIQVIDWRKGHAENYPLLELGGGKVNFHLIDEQTIVISGNSHLTLYTLRELDGLPQRKITYLLPGLKYHHSSLFYILHTSSSSHYGAAVLPDFMHGYTPSPDSQIMVLEIVSPAWPVILVIDMVILSEPVICSETPVEVPWSDWGPQYTCCFPHHPSHRISVFGSKMAYALPLDRTPKPGERLERLSNSEGYFYVHIWDFKKRAIARGKDVYDRNSSDPPIRKPGELTRSPFVEDIISNHPYIATVCRTPFLMNLFVTLFLEQDRLILTWSHPDSHIIKVFCPIADTNFMEQDTLV